MRQAPLLLSFFLGLFAALFGTAFMPRIHLLAFAPFLAIVYTRKSFPASLWWAFICGIIIDLLSSELRFGINAINYCLATVLIYRQKKHFFDDKPMALSLFTALVSSVSTLLHIAFLYSFDKKIPLNWMTAVTSLIGMPIADAIYAFVWFTCPIKLYMHIKRIGFKALFRRQKEEE